MIPILYNFTACIPDPLFPLFSWLALQTRTHILVSSLVISWSITELRMILNHYYIGIRAIKINCIIETRGAVVAVRLAEDVLLN